MRASFLKHNRHNRLETPATPERQPVHAPPLLQYICTIPVFVVVEAWLIHEEGFIARLHTDMKSLRRDPMLFVDYGQEMPDGQPALLKSRRHRRKPRLLNFGSR